MKRLSHILIALILAASCSDPPGLISLRRGDSLHRDIHREVIHQAGSFVPDSSSLSSDSSFFDEPEIPPRVFACGVEHPESETPLFVVFEDGVRALEYTLNTTAVDADSHFLIGSDMYLVAAEGTSTVLYKNGVKEFSYPAMEYISSLLRREDGLWTLGADRSGDGFALRHDGSPVFVKTSGSPGRLYQDEGHLYFDYSLTVGGKTLRYLVKDGDDFALSAPNGGELRAVLVSEGEMWFLEDSKDGWLLSCGERKYEYSARPGFGFRSAELFGKPGGCAAVINMVALAFGMPAELVCSEEETWLKGGGSGSYHYYDSVPDVHITFTRNMEQLAVHGYGGAFEERLDSVRFEGSRCAMQYCGQIYLACNPMDGSPPFIWKRGNMRMPLELNGRLTGIYVEAPD